MKTRKLPIMSRTLEPKMWTQMLCNWACECNLLTTAKRFDQRRGKWLVNWRTISGQICSQNPCRCLHFNGFLVVKQKPGADFLPSLLLSPLLSPSFFVVGKFNKSWPQQL